MNHRPKKKFGQNFLKDQSVIDAILHAADLDQDSRVVEIGPGLGALTHELCARAGSLTVFEIDPDLVAHWSEIAPSNMALHQGDVLKSSWTDLLKHPPYSMVANLPYNISSQVVFKLLDHHQLFNRLVLMFQKEVADRLKALPGTKDYGILSVLCRLHFDIRQVVAVPPGAFYPAPKVQSSVLRFIPLSKPRCQVEDESLLRKLVKAAFGQRRKTLLNALSSGGFQKEDIHRICLHNDIDVKRRGETLSLEEFVALANDFANLEPAAADSETAPRS